MPTTGKKLCRTRQNAERFESPAGWTGARQTNMGTQPLHIRQSRPLENEGAVENKGTGLDCTWLTELVSSTSADSIEQLEVMTKPVCGPDVGRGTGRGPARSERQLLYLHLHRHHFGWWLFRV